MDLDFSEAEIQRYARHILLPDIGGLGQTRLRAASVLVVGAGGLGAPLLMYLAAAGIGRLGIVDDDRIELSNLQRQIAFTTTDVGQEKAAVTAEVLRRLNPHVTVEPHATRLDAANARSLVSDYDITCDGTDNFATRYVLADACVAARRTLVSAAVLRHEGQLAVFKPHAGDFPCLRCLYPEPPPPGLVPSCAEAGVLGAVTGVMGTLQATEVIKEVLGIGDTLAGRLLVWDALAARMRVLVVPRDPACRVCGTRHARPTVIADAA